MKTQQEITDIINRLDATITVKEQELDDLKGVRQILGEEVMTMKIANDNLSSANERLVEQVKQMGQVPVTDVAVGELKTPPTP